MSTLHKRGRLAAAPIRTFVSIGPRAYKAWIGRARDF